MNYETFRPVLEPEPSGAGKNRNKQEAGGELVPSSPQEAAETRNRLALPRDIDNLLALLRKPTHVLTSDESFASMVQRQETVNKFLLRGGAEALSNLFTRIKQIEEKETIKLDLSMLELSDKLLGGLYLPGVNAEKLVFSLSDISGSDIRAGNFTAAVATRAIMRGVIATGSDWTDAVIPRADLSGGRFVGGTFVNTDMRGAIVDRDTNFVGAVFIGTYVGGVDLSIANTAGAVFKGIRR
ncbi:MAG: pentapeptide repeat-containing protein [Candidatus Levyibacteriota bacterium]